MDKSKLLKKYMDFSNSSTHRINVKDLTELKMKLTNELKEFQNSDLENVKIKFRLTLEVFQKILIIKNQNINWMISL